MQTGTKIFGNQGYFAREGDAFALPANGVVGRNSKPDIEDAAFVEMGLIEADDGMEVENKKDVKEIFAPTPGRYRRFDAISTKSSMDVSIVTKEFSPLAFQALFGTAALTAVLNAAANNKQYVPLAGDDLKGWLHVEQFDQTDTLVNTFESYGRLDIDGPVKFNGDIISVKFKFMVLYSSLNSGLLA